MQITVVVPCCREKVGELIHSLHRQSLAKNFFEVLICQNSDNKLQALQDLPPHFTHIQLPDYDVHGARNAGLARAQGELLLFLDDDCVLPHDKYLEELLELHKKHTYFALGGEYTSKHGSSLICRAINKTVSFWLNKNAHVLVGGCMSFKRKQWPKDLYFPENLFQMGGEELFIFGEFRKRKLKSLQLKQLDVLHNCDHSFSDYLRRAVSHGKALVGLCNLSNTPTPIKFFAFLKKLSRSLFQEPISTTLAAGYLVLVHLSFSFYFLISASNSIRSLDARKSTQ